MSIDQFLNTQVTIVANNLLAGVRLDHDTQRVATIKQCLIDYPMIYKDRIDEIRKEPYHSDRQKELKKTLPCWFPCGVFQYQNITNKGILQYSNIVAIDVDKQDNPDLDFDELRKNLFGEFYVCAVLKSVSNAGLYVLIEVEHGIYTSDYYDHIARLWKQSWDVNVDVNAKNIGRKRFISFDEDTDKWIKESRPYTNCTPIIENYTRFTPFKPIHQREISFTHNPEERTHQAIQRLINDGYYIDGTGQRAYNAWLYTGGELKNFADGFDLWVQMSNNHPSYHDTYESLLKKWNTLRINPVDDDTHRKWQGMAKNKYGKGWYKDE